MHRIESLVRLTEWLASLPKIGRRSAENLAYHIIEMEPERVKQFAEDMYRARLAVRRCSVCGNLTDGELCSVCADEKRDRSVICVVSDYRDVEAMERVREYRGVYHVLGGSINPLKGAGPSDIRIKELLERLDGSVREVILATNPDGPGETTATYIARLIAPKGITVTRLAHGIPIGGELEYTDEVTLLRALEGRRQL